MNKALEIFSKKPRTCNCSQSVAAGLGKDDLLEALASCGGGRAPGGLCGALYAAQLIAGEGKRKEIEEAFRAAIGAVHCREIKGVRHVACERCVETAAELAAKFSGSK